MDPANALCSRCKRKEAVVFCTCTRTEALLCKECVIPHSAKEPGKKHATYPMPQLCSHMIPGYFERLRVRIDSFPLLKQQALQGSLEINRAIDEYKLGVEKAIFDLTVASKASIDQLLGMRDELDREMQAAVEEVERTLAEDQPHTYSRYAPLLRQFAESARSLELISFSVQTCPITPQDWVVLHLHQIHEQSESVPETVQIELESVMLTNEAKLKQAQLPEFRYSRSVPVWELVEPIKLSDGSVYIGELRSGKRCGPGKLLIWEGGLMEGYWANDFLHGKGRYIYPIGDMYAGDYFEGEKQGFGRVEDLSGFNSYEGEWLHDKKHGKGIEHIEDGLVYEGQFENNTKSGLGVFKWASGEFYKGCFKAEGNMCGRRKRSGMMGSGWKARCMERGSS